MPALIVVFEGGNEFPLSLIKELGRSRILRSLYFNGLRNQRVTGFSTAWVCGLPDPWSFPTGEMRKFGEVDSVSTLLSSSLPSETVLRSKRNGFSADHSVLLTKSEQIRCSYENSYTICSQLFFLNIANRGHPPFNDKCQHFVFTARYYTTSRCSVHFLTHFKCSHVNCETLLECSVTVLNEDFLTLL
ncbi:hypothetical protein AVEN_176289-1 [Araneus ventricosus]|uniref:Uncharacterized protein n=1 Tax=Araneus ventricosus TaxID=182803 RepID=A0A4Y2HS97_ARAVE|nr:hypothetical protein AVEN_176289-1 [Araneus ventricosus]